MKASERPLLIYKSSAGSGKTTQIVREYFSLAIPHPRLYSSILAITFTNKAAGEMKERIIEILGEITNSDSLTPKTRIYVDPLINKGFSEERIQKSAKELMDNILHDYSGFAVSTIDSLMHRIVRSFAFDLKLSSSFNVILDQKELIQQSVDLLLDNLGKDDRLTGFLVQFMKDNMSENRSWHIENALYNFGTLLHDEDARKYIDRLQEIDLDSFVDIRKKLNAFTSSFEKEVGSVATEGLKLIRHIPESAFSHGKQGIPGYFKSIEDEKYKTDGLSRLYGNSYVKKFAEEGKFTSSKAKPEEKEQIEQLAPEIIDLYNRIYLITSQRGEKYMLFNLLKRNLHSMAVLQEIEGYLNQLKTEEDYVHISEFNHIIARQIWQNGSVPFIYERIGEKYQHIFIDEFQDTSVLQWHNLLPLVTNGLASGKESMIVGDGKQAIYRFRSGEVDQFNKLPQLHSKEMIRDGHAQEAILKSSGGEYVLEDNFRSCKDIVEFNNRFFEFVKNNSNEKIKEVYTEHQQNPRKEKPGCVTIDFVDGRGEELLENNLQKVTDHISECMEMGYNQGDIAVLCRKNSEGIKVARHISESGYEVISSDSLLLSSSPELHFVTAVLRLIHDPQDTLSKTEIYSYLFRNNKWPLDHTNLHEGIERLVQSQNTGRQNDLLTQLGLDTQRVNERSLYDLVEYIIRHFSLNQKPDPFITFFMNEIRELTERGQTNLSDCLDWWEDNKTKTSVVVPEGIDAVRVYTIHKAKGLEFPVVIYPFITKNTRPTKSNEWFFIEDEMALEGLPVVNLPLNARLEDTRFDTAYEEEMDKSLLDEVNVHYVAFTRPKERLYLVAEYPSKKASRITIPSLLHGFLNQSGYWQEDQETYVFGELHTVPERKPVSDEETISLQQLISDDWHSKLVVAPEAPEKWDVGDSGKSRRWGELVHRALAEVSRPEDIAVVVDRFEVKGFIDSAVKDDFKHTVERVVTHEAIRPFFEHGLKVKNEASLFSPEGKMLRPDKLIFKDREVIIIEYKTGQPEDYHISQIESYRKALKAMGYPHPEACLVYIDEEIILKKV